jgi:tetratricopeptide (TPR) repeat protein
LAVNICAFVFLLVLFFWQTKRWKKIALLSSVVLTLSVITLTGVLHIGNQRDHSVSERKFYVLGALDLIKQKPLVGHGIGTFQVNYPRVKRVEAWAYDAVCFQYVRNVYNELLEIWHDEGIVGLLLFMTLLWMVVSKGFATLSRHGAQQHHSTAPALLGKAEFIIAALSAIAGLVVSNAFSLSMRYVSTALPFWVLMGMLSATASADSAVVKFPLHIRLTGDTNGAKRPAIHHWVLLGGQLLVVFGLCLVIFWYGRLFLADSEMAKAIAHSKQAYGVVSEDESTLFHDIYKEGTLYHSDMQEWEKAIGAYLKVLRLNPHNLRAHYMLANAFNRRELTQKQYAPQWGDRNGIARTDIDRALEHYGYVIQQAPNYAEVDYEIGTAYMKAGAIDSAIAAYNDYARYRRFFTKIHYALAQAFVAKRDWESAEKAYDEVLELNAQFTRAYLEQSAVCRMQGKDGLADDYYHKAEELSADYAKTTIIDIYESLNGWQEALEQIDYALAQTPRDASLYVKQGWMYIQLNNYPLALQAYRQAISLDSSNVLCFINLSNLYYTLDDLDNAKATLERALALDSNAVKRAVQRAGNGR